MQHILSVAAMRACDATTIANGTDSKTLMYRAGLALFQSCCWLGKIDIVTGSGNNAGDGYVLALLLQKAEIPCRIVLCSEKFSEDGAYYFQQCQAARIPTTREIDFSHTDILVDCLLGTGFQGMLRPNLQSIIQKINASTAHVISVDINSGMNGDTGSSSCCVQSERTVSIGMLQFGHFVGLANGAIHELYNYDIGISCTESFVPYYTAVDLPLTITKTSERNAFQIFRFSDAMKKVENDKAFGETFSERITSYSNLLRSAVLLYTDQFLYLCDGAQGCFLEASLSLEQCHTILEQHKKFAERCATLLQESNSHFIKRAISFF